MIAVHVFEDLGLGSDERTGIRDLGEHFGRRKVRDAAETRDEVCHLQRHLVEGEVLESDEHLRFGVAQQIAAARRHILGERGIPHEHDARAFERIAFLALVQHERHAGIGKDIPRVDRKPGDQQNRRAVRRGCDIDERAVGIA